MTHDRESDLLAKIERLPSLAEATGFREQLSLQGEFTGTVYVRLTQRMEVLAKREGKA